MMKRRIPCYCPKCGKHKDAPKRPASGLRVEYVQSERAYAIIIDPAVLLIDEREVELLKRNRPMLPTPVRVVVDQTATPYAGGRAWRTSVARMFGLRAIDFECARGRAWRNTRWRERLSLWLQGRWTLWRRPSRGLGDTVAKMTKTVGIRPCGGCRKRQARLNELIPYRSAVEELSDGIR